MQTVDVIHTDAGILGAGVATGSVDFWPNGGTIQPGCPLSNEFLCDHQRSWYYFSESVRNSELTFFAVKCESYEKFLTFNCSDGELNNMGIDASLT